MNSNLFPTRLYSIQIEDERYTLRLFKCSRMNYITISQCSNPIKDMRICVSLSHSYMVGTGVTNRWTVHSFLFFQTSTKPILNIICASLTGKCTLTDNRQHYSYRRPIILETGARRSLANIQFHSSRLFVSCRNKQFSIAMGYACITSHFTLSVISGSSLNLDRSLFSCV